MFYGRLTRSISLSKEDCSKLKSTSKLSLAQTSNSEERRMNCSGFSF